MKYFKHLVYFLIVLVSCDTENPQKETIIEKEPGWTPVDSSLIETTDDLPAVKEIKPPADKSLSSFLPKKVYEYIGDNEVQNSDLKTNTGITIKSVVRVYRKQDHMVGINVSDFSNLSEKEQEEIFNYNFRSLNAISSKKGSNSKNININSNVSGKLVYSTSLNKAIIVLRAYNNILVTISGDTNLEINKFENITKLINFEELKKIKQLS